MGPEHRVAYICMHRLRVHHMALIMRFFTVFLSSALRSLLQPTIPSAHMTLSPAHGLDPCQASYVGASQTGIAVSVCPPDCHSLFCTLVRCRSPALTLQPTPIESLQYPYPSAPWSVSSSSESPHHELPLQEQCNRPTNQASNKVFHYTRLHM